MSSVSRTTTVRVTPAPADWLAGATVSIMRSMTRLTVCAMTGGASSMSETVTIPVAIDVTKDTRSVRRTICDLESCSMFIVEKSIPFSVVFAKKSGRPGSETQSRPENHSVGPSLNWRCHPEPLAFLGLELDDDIEKIEVADAFVRGRSPLAACLKHVDVEPPRVPDSP